MTETGLVTTESVARAILVRRGCWSILDSEFAALYGVAVSVFNQAVKRNVERFPADFTFQLTREEYESLIRSQFVILKAGRGAHRKYLPYVFTEHGADKVVCRSRLGGMLNYYHREVA